MRVVVVDLLCNSPVYCGELVKALCDAGAEAELASPEFWMQPGLPEDYRQCSWIADLAVHAGHPRTLRLGIRAIELSYNYVRLLREIRRNRYQAIHVQWIPLQDRQTLFMSRLRSACDRAGAPLVFTAHNVLPHDTPAANRVMIRKNVELAHAIIAHTQNVADGLRREIGVNSDIAVIPHGPLSTDLELPLREDAAARLDLGWDPVVLFQGLIRPYKGIDVLVEAWPHVRAAYPTATLAVVGRSISGTVRSQLEKLAEIPGVRILDSYVETDTMLDYYAVSDVVVFPYTAISQSGALMTAIGLGRPVVVTPLPGFIEQVDGLESVIVAVETNGPAVAEALCSALRDRERLADLASRDRSRIMESRAGWPSVAQKTIDVYVSARGLLHAPSGGNRR